MEARARSGNSRWKDLRRRLCFQGGVGCCGSSWGFRERMVVHGDPGCEIPAASSSPDETINLAEALAAERQLGAASAPTQPQRGRVDEESYQWEAAASSGAGAPLRVSLMSLLMKVPPRAETEAAEEGCPGAGWSCCVCMGRRKAAALIPCGHTFCRVCSRELRLNRGACPLCNRRILDVLDIF